MPIDLNTFQNIAKTDHARVKIKDGDLVGTPKGFLGRAISILTGSRQEKNKAVYNEFKSLLKTKYGVLGEQALTTLKPKSKTRLSSTTINSVIQQAKQNLERRQNQTEGLLQAHGADWNQLPDQTVQNKSLISSIQHCIQQLNLPTGNKFMPLCYDPEIMDANLIADGVDIENLKPSDRFQTFTEQIQTGSCGGDANAIIEMIRGREIQQQHHDGLKTHSDEVMRRRGTERPDPGPITLEGIQFDSVGRSGEDDLVGFSRFRDMIKKSPGDKPTLHTMDIGAKGDDSVTTLHRFVVIAHPNNKVEIIQGFVNETGVRNPPGYTADDWLSPENSDRQILDADDFLAKMKSFMLHGTRDGDSAELFKPVQSERINRMNVGIGDLGEDLYFGYSSETVDMNDIINNLKDSMINRYMDKVKYGMIE